MQSHMAIRGEQLLMIGVENAAPSSALPLGSSRVLSPTRLTRVDPSGPAHVHRLMNAVLAIVHILPGDKIIKEKEKDQVSSATAVKTEAKEETQEGGAEIKPDGIEDVKEEPKEEEEVEEEEDMDDEVPYIEDIGTREVAGFIVM